jgi:hypothetical protein
MVSSIYFIALTIITTIFIYVSRKKKIKPKFNIRLKVTDYEKKNNKTQVKTHPNVFHFNDANLGLQKSIPDFSNQSSILNNFPVPLFNNQLMPKITEPVYYSYPNQNIPIIIKKQKTRNRIEPANIIKYQDEPIYVIDGKRKSKIISNDQPYEIYDNNDQIKYVYQ